MPDIHPVLFSVILGTAALTAGLALCFVIDRIIIVRVKKFAPALNNSALRALRAPLASLVPALILRTASVWMTLPDDAARALSHSVSLWIIASSGWLAVQMVNLARNILLSRYDIKASDNLEARRVYTQVRVIENIVDILIVLLTLSVMLMTFDSVRQVGVSLLASAGLAGIVLGFAAQKTLGNFIAGIQLAFAQPIRLDDVVIVEGEWGWIEEISLTYVVVKIWDLRRLVVPVSYFIDKPFQNWTRTSADILGTVFLYADYTVPVDRVRQELTRIVGQSPHWDKKTVGLQVTNATAQTVELRALMSAASSPAAWDLRCEVREKLLAFFQRELPEHLPRTRVSVNPDRLSPAGL